MSTEKNAAAALELLDEIRRLMELKGENPFKVRAFEKAAEQLSGRTDLAERARAGTLTELPGIGKGIAEVLREFLLQGTSSARDELRASIPPGLLELTQVPGLGPKKAVALIEELGVHSLAELEYACRENRLLALKGFGAKAQAKILENLQFLKSTQGQLRLEDAFPRAEAFFAELRQELGSEVRVSETGAIRRRMEVVEAIEFVSERAPARAPEAPLSVRTVPSARFGYELARTTASEAHWKALGSPKPFDARTEEEFYTKLGLPWIAPELRETGEEVELARKGKLAELLPWDGVRGIFHNHTTRSDGAATLEEMVLAAKKAGYEYIGISDHSQSAFYAQGLKTPAIREQEREVRAVQERHPEIRVFWGIESDILADGSLDYDEATLKRFDFVIASVHSRFQMDRHTMTERVLQAVRHPATRFLGHLTGRLLLGRKGYELEMERVIEEAARYDVAIEINANPARLDIDWRFGPELRRCGTPVSINPDAHSTEEIANTRFGVAMARKALLPSRLVVNSRPLKEVESWLRRA